MSLTNEVGHLLPVLYRIAHVLNEHSICYALIGGLGVSVRGQIRATLDIDLLLTIPQLELPGVLDALIAEGFQLDQKQAIERWNRESLMECWRGSVRVDWLKPVLPVFERILDRARWEQVEGRQVRVADAEGLILLKLLALRTRDLDDITRILKANAGQLDLDWIRTECRQVCPEGDPRLDQFEKYVNEFYSPTEP